MRIVDRLPCDECEGRGWLALGDVEEIVNPDGLAVPLDWLGDDQ